MNRLDFHKLAAFEARWDDRLGGIVSRGFREVLLYVAARIGVLSGCSFDQILDYMRDAEALGLGESLDQTEGDA